jgi:hypothetical protein
MTEAQMKWLATYNRETGSLSTYAARDCGYGDAISNGLAVNRGPHEMPDLYITDEGIRAVNSLPQPKSRTH